MKKILAWLLIVVMCFALVACNSNSGSNSDIEKARNEIVGKWETTELNGLSITFNEDGTGTYYDNQTTWKYDIDLSCYIVCVCSGSVSNMMMCIDDIKKDDNGAYYIEFGTVKVYRVNE